jgi:hypothetical protein
MCKRKQGNGLRLRSTPQLLLCVALLSKSTLHIVKALELQKKKATRLPPSTKENQTETDDKSGKKKFFFPFFLLYLGVAADCLQEEKGESREKKDLK